MKLDKFVDKLYEAGWRPTCDGQHDGIEDLHGELFKASPDAGAKLACNEGLCTEDRLRQELDLEKIFCLALINTLNTDLIAKVTGEYIELRDNREAVLKMLAGT